MNMKNTLGSERTVEIEFFKRDGLKNTTIILM